MSHELSILPSGRLSLVEHPSAGEGSAPLPPGLVSAFSESASHGLLHLATSDLQVTLPPPWQFARTIASTYLTRLCQTQGHESAKSLPPTPPPTPAELAAWVLQAPPMTGLEYLQPEAITGWWEDLDTLVREEIRKSPGGAQAYLTSKNPLWKWVGRVTLHLAENKRDPDYPFAFLATYVSRLTPQGKVQHEPLARALQQYAGEGNRKALLSLLMPLEKASEKSPLIKDLTDTGDIYHTLAWKPREAHRFLQDVLHFEDSGLIVRVPDWWKPRRPARAVVDVKIDGKRGTRIGVDSLLDFSVEVALDGEHLSEEELQEVLASSEGLIQLKGKWVEIDHDRLAQTLEQWKEIQARVKKEGLTFFEGMRLLAGAPLERDTASDLTEVEREWTGLRAGPELAALLDRMKAPESREVSPPPELRAELRAYQHAGLSWLSFLTNLGLGACLADDMGLGKTIQVIALLLARKHMDPKASSKEEPPRSNLLVVPASLIANWKAEIDRFGPSLRYGIAHASETSDARIVSADQIPGHDLVITTYGMLTRLNWLREQQWGLVILDEAQAIKNSGTRQSRAVKELEATSRIAMTGTPVENRLSDLWSLFDFLNPGLLGNAKAFGKFVKQMESPPAPSYKPLRSLVGPYILRRLKTDRRVIADLPDKTEVKAFCGLSKRQAVLYGEVVNELAEKLEVVEGIQRRGLVLAQLMRLKQICNHPDQLTGQAEYDPRHSAKFLRLGELCEEMAQRQEKVLVFTQFREITEPLSQFLESVFVQPGLVLHGGIPVPRRRELVERFQRENGPPFFILSVKAGGTGLNLTAASQVIHFDRWWNPAVEDQATDRAFRIGQKRNVLVHKFVCRGTVEERIDALIAEKTELVRDVVEGGERLLTEMSNKELLDFVALDVNKALES